MPTFQFTSPEGKSYSVQGPDGATPEQAFQILQTQIGGSPAPAAGSSVAGVAKSLGTGLAEGGIGLAGMAGDLTDLGAKGIEAASNYVNDKLGLQRYERPSTPSVLNNIPTAASLQKNVENVTGPFYQPQGTAEDIANKIGQFAPAVIGGPESLAAKVATRVVAPAVASEAGGAVAGPLGEVAGALAGGAGASAALNKVAALRAASSAAAVPAVDEIKAAARAQYQHPDVQAVQIHPQAVSDLADTISSDLQHGQNSGFRPANEPKVFGAVDELKTALNEGRPASVADLDNVRQVLGNAAKERDVTGSLTRQAVAANRAIDHIDNFLPNLQQPDLIAGDASKANAILEDARQNWGAAKRAEQVQTIAKNAEINAASANSGANLQNSTKQAFKPLLKNNYAKAGGYTDIEKQALNKIVRGTWTGTVARAAGNLLGGGGGLGMLAGGAAGYEEGGLPGAIAVGLVGRGLKAIGVRSTLGAVKNLDTLLRSRAPEALKVAAQNPKIVQLLPSDSVKALRTMILAEPSLKQQPGSDDKKRQVVRQ